jgi:hypothetical protein
MIGCTAPLWRKKPIVQPTKAAKTSRPCTREKKEKDQGKETTKKKGLK